MVELQETRQVMASVGAGELNAHTCMAKGSVHSSASDEQVGWGGGRGFSLVAGNIPWAGAGTKGVMGDLRPW